VLEFDDFVCLDVQKTGSATIRQPVERHGRGALVRDETRRPLRRTDPRETFFISCRDPLARYVSAHSYGYGPTPTGLERGQHGTIYTSVKRSGMADVHHRAAKGHSACMDLASGPAVDRAIFVGHDARGLLEVTRLQSLPFAAPSLPSPEQALAHLTSVKKVVERLIDDGLADVVLRTGSLLDQLRLMCDGAHGDIIADPEQARRYLETDPARLEPINPGLKPESLSRRSRRRRQHRDGLFFEILGYERHVCEARDD
jgi:hypothetical protein